MKKILLYSLLAIGIFSLIGINMASARGWFMGGFNADPETIAERQGQMFERQASLLGIGIDQIKEYWSQGKNTQDIIEELGIDKEKLQGKMAQERQENMKARLQVLVDKGVISQEQANRRLQTMEEKFQNRGFGRGFGGRHGCQKGFGW